MAPPFEDIRVEMRDAMQSLKERIDERFDDVASSSRDRHSENVSRLVRIENEVRQTNGRVTRHDEQIQNLMRTRDWKPDRTTIDGRTLTLADIKWHLICTGGGSAFTLWLMRMLGKI